jgi:hypothetical protein
LSSTKKQPRQDRDVQRDGKANHPFQQHEFRLKLDKAAIDPAKRRHGDRPSLLPAIGKE